MFFDVPDKPPSGRRDVIVGAKCTFKLGVVTEEMRWQHAAVVVGVILVSIARKSREKEIFQSTH